MKKTIINKDKINSIVRFIPKPKINVKKIKSLAPHPYFGFETWKYNKTYGVYVSSLGNLKDKNGEVVKPKIMNGYMYYVKNNKNAIPMHRLVLGTFKPIDEWGFYTVDHLNHNTRDNSLHNLEWVSGEENSRRAKEDEVDPCAKDVSGNGAKLYIEKKENLNKKYGIPSYPAPDIDLIYNDVPQNTVTISVNGMGFTEEDAIKTVPVLITAGVNKDTLIKTIKDVSSGTKKEVKYGGAKFIHIDNSEI